MKTFIKISIISISLFLTACPQKQSSQDETVVNSSVQLEKELAKTSTGQDSLNYLKGLRQSGVEVNVSYKSTAELQSINGHTGGSWKKEGNVITIFINNEISINDQTHALAHELVHVKDDAEVEAMENSHPDIKSQVKNFLDNLATQGTQNVDPRVVKYVLSTLFCMETRGYTKNALLNQQGYPSQGITTTGELGAYIDQHYIVQTFHVTYGSNAEAMKTWCLRFNSMTQIQNQLIW